MTLDEIVRAKKWNEHIRLVVAFANSSSVAMLVLAITKPLTEPDNPLSDLLSSSVNDKLRAFEQVTPTDVSWLMFAGIGAIQVCAHLLIRMTISEE